MAADLDRIERKLLALLGAADCEVCATRTSSCPNCGRPTGMTEAEAGEVRRKLDEALDELGVKRGRRTQSP